MVLTFSDSEEGPDYLIWSNSFSSSLLNNMTDFIVTQLDDKNVEDIISSVTIKNWIDECQPTTSKEINLLFFWDWDVFAIDLIHLDRRFKIGGTSYISIGVIKSTLTFLKENEIHVRMYKPTQNEINNIIDNACVGYN